MHRKTEGIIVSDKMQHTRVVVLTRLKKHPKYHKYMKITKRVKAHDEQNSYKVGDTVIIEETKPASKEKRWNIIKLVARKEELNETI